MLGKQVPTAINNLQILTQRLKVAQDLEASPDHSMNIDDQSMVELRQAVYSAEDAADTLLTREAFQITKTKTNGSKKRFQWPSVTSLCGQSPSTNDSDEANTLENDFREHLSSYDHLVEMTSHMEEYVGYSHDNISRSQNNHKGLQSQHVQQRWGKISGFCLEETDVVGLEEQKMQLLDLILLKDPDFDVLAAHAKVYSKVIAVVDEAGSVKKALVRAVYNKLLQMRDFIHHAWVHAPSLYKAKYVLANILRQIKLSDFAVNAEVSEEKLRSELTAELGQVKYLIVVEDVVSREDFAKIYNAVTSNSRNSAGSRIIITTRSENVASNFTKAESVLIKVPQLVDEDRWKLFLHSVQVVDDVLITNSNLNALKKRILKACGDDILNSNSRLVLLGGLLSTKEPSFDEWSRVIEHADNIGGDIFALCYQDLPSQVKPCFLYMGLFPKGFVIPVRRLIHLWIYEGFVTAPLDPVADTFPEDLAEMYFKELVIRNMIQVRWRLDGIPKTCFMPVALYDIFSPKAADVGFFYHQLLSSHDSSDKQPQFAVRRLAKALGIKNNVFRTSLPEVENLRSFVAFDIPRRQRPAIETAMFLNKINAKKGFGLLKVLDLEGAYKPVLPDDAMGKLFLLSYLGLRSTAIDSLPSSVGYLPCLETLDVKHTIIQDVPTSIWQAKKLRHLYLNWSFSSIFSSSSLSSQPPTNLHTLWGLTVSDGAVDFLKMLSGLRKLGLRCISRPTAVATIQWVSQLTKLHSLKMRSALKGCNDVFDLDFPSMANHCKLEHLYLLQGLSKRSLNDVEFPPNLRMLTLSRSGLEDDPMPLLGRLPHLKVLRLFANSYRGKMMTCEGGGFPNLLVLKLWGLPLDERRVEERAMPCLRELEIRWCIDLCHSSVLQHLTTLTEVILINTPLTGTDFVGGEERNLYMCKRG